MKLRNHLRSAFAQTLAAVRAAPMLPSVAVVSIAVGLLVVGLTYLAARNAAALLQSWGEGIELTIYFEPGAPAARAGAVAEGLRRLPGVDRVRYITSAEALQRLREGMGQKSPLLDGVEDDVLPPSLEVSFHRGQDDPKTLAAIGDRVSKMPGVAEVETMGDWVRRLQAAADLLRGLALAALLVVAAACLYLVGATIKLAVFARRAEIEILKLVGATDLYVRVPFWIEGALEGLAGALLGAAALYLTFRRFAPRVEALLGGVLGGVQLRFPPLSHLALGAAAAVLLGLVGSHLAVRRHLQSQPR